MAAVRQHLTIGMPQRRTQRVQLARFCARVAGAVNEQRRRMQLRKVSSIEVRVRPLLFGEAQPRSAVTSDDPAPIVAVIVLQDRSDAIAD